MIITELELIGFEPLTYSSGIRRVVYKPQQLMQLLLGDNGSGKSSLLLALSFSPLDRKLFLADGYRALTAEDNGNTYRLISHYGAKSAKHEFWINDDNLNPGGTTAVQNDLVTSHMRYTKFIHQILSGKSSFCNMSNPAREDLLVSVSRVDMTYIYDCFKRVTGAYRDAQGVERHLKSRHLDIVKRIEQVQTDSNIGELITHIENDLMVLIPQTNFSLTDFRLQDVISHKMEQFTDLSKQAVQQQTRLVQWVSRHRDTLNQYRDLDSLSSAVDYMDASMQLKQKGIQDLQSRLSQYADMQSRLSELPKDTNIADIKNQLTTVNDKLKTMRTPPMTADWESHYQSTAVAKQKIMALIETMPPDTGMMSKQTMHDIELAYKQQNELVQRLQYNLKNLNHSIDHMSATLAGAVICPKCNHKVIQDTNISEASLQRLRDNAKKVAADLDTAENALVLITEDYDRAQWLKATIQHLSDVVYKHACIRDTLVSVGNIMECIVNHWNTYTALDQYMRDCKQYAEYDRLMATKARLEFFYQTLMMSASTGDQWTQLETELADTYTELEQLKKQQVIIASGVKLITGCHQLVTDALTLAQSIQDTVIDNLQAGFSLAVNAHTRNLQGRLSELQTRVRESQTLQDRLNDTENELKQYQQRLAVLKRLVTAASPTVGIIGQQLFAINHSFVTAVNRIVSAVWEKDILMTVPVLGKNTKYSVDINGKPGPDLADLSSGQKDIFDLAVSIVVMSQMELNDYPLYLDEVGKTFDERHRDNLMLFIKNLVSGGICSMVFIVSHYAEQHGGFSNVDINVLDDSNITVRSDAVNQCLDLYR